MGCSSALVLRRVLPPSNINSKLLTHSLITISNKIKIILPINSKGWSVPIVEATTEVIAIIVEEAATATTMEVIKRQINSFQKHSSKYNHPLLLAI